MKTLIAIVSFICIASFSNAQLVIRYNFGKPATVVSFVKEVIVWEGGKKISHDSYAGDKNEIYLSDTLIRITEKNQILEYKIKEVRVDEFENVSFLDEENTVLRWHRGQRLFQVEPSNTNEEIVYYVD